MVKWPFARGDIASVIVMSTTLQSFDRRGTAKFRLSVVNDIAKIYFSSVNNPPES
jgi:hypothetical protein